MALIIPPDTRAVGTPDPANDMNNAADVLGLIVQALSRLTQLTGSVPAPPGGNASNIAAVQNLAAGKAVYVVPGTVPAVVAGNESLNVGAPATTSANVMTITDDPANPRSGAANMFVIQDHLNAPIFSVGAAGGPKVFGDRMGSWNGVSTMAAQLVPWWGVQVGGASGPTIYGGSGAPLPAGIVTALGTYSQVANVGDMYARTDNGGVTWYFCTTAGTGGSRGGTWTPNLQVPGNINVTFGNVDCSLAGTGFRAAEGSNAKQGTFALSGAATTVVANTSVTASSRIFLQTMTLGTVTVASTLAVSAISAGVSFTVKPSQSTDTSTVAFEIFEPG